MLTIIILTTFLLTDSFISLHNETYLYYEKRRLELIGAAQPRDIKKIRNKLERSAKIHSTIKDFPVPDYFKPDDGTPSHNPRGPAVFAAAMNVDATRHDAMMFVGSLRETGYLGDIVLAILPKSNPAFIKVLRDYNCITYTVNPDCVGEDHSKVCSFDIGDNAPKVSINMVRFYMYQWWARVYETNALILVSDFRDVFFQSNPFTYKPSEWAPPVAQFVAFQEPYPNKVIYRCVFNGGWIENCYGTEGLRKIGSNTVSCSGVSIATRNALMVYAYLMTQQLDPRVRYGRNTTKTNGACITAGMDQGFHNWLLYSGQLGKYVDIKIYQQGEGPVNTIGGFFGTRIPLKFPLKEWLVMRGDEERQIIYNWNGEVSPCVHQADRFLNGQMGSMYENLAVGQKVLALMRSGS